MHRLVSRGLPFVFTPHGKLTPGMMATRPIARQACLRLLTLPALAHAAAIVTSSEREARAQSRRGLPVVSAAIPNGYARPPQAPATPARRPRGRPYVLYLGYIDPRKNEHSLILAFARSQARKTHDLRFVGPDAYHHADALKRLCAAQGLTDCVQFDGPAYGDAKWAALRDAACICLPSKADEQPVVLAEAVGAELPAIYTPECNSDHITLAGAGIEVPCGDLAAWASAIDRVCLDAQAAAAMRQAARRLGCDLRWDAIVVRWMALYDEVASGVRRAGAG